MSTRHERMGNKSLNDQHSKILKDLMQRSDNRKCVDCRKKDPRWASWNLGVFMCIRCSGVHRSIGTHITKVKSADLDAWTPEQIENMCRWGNGRANVYWEAGLPADFAGPNESNIDQWIRDKYDGKRFAARGPLPDPETIPLPAGVTATVPSRSSTPVIVQKNTTAPVVVVQQQLPVKTASQDLLDMFPSDSNGSGVGSSKAAVAPALPPQNDFKANLMSLYASPTPKTQSQFPSQQQQQQQPPTQQLAGLQFFSTTSQQQGGFANFASFPASNAGAAPAGLGSAVGSAMMPGGQRGGAAGGIPDFMGAPPVVGVGKKASLGDIWGEFQ
ncbi:hypothetical protein HDU98_007550 [Podochytrium sp. JEL0797]|nr:hypothetical protein HDU98_007550 [Podochytrium sp. JEL0797]